MVQDHGRSARFRGAVALCFLLAGAVPARADLLVSTPGLHGLGSFTGSFRYAPADATHATLSIVLTNNSPAANGGFLTAFAFNNPQDRITGATLTASNKNFSLLGAPHFHDDVKAGPFGRFDLGAGTGHKFEGGGKPSRGIGVGQTATFTFHLTGHALDTLHVSDFFSTLSVGPGRHEGHVAFLARFRDFVHGDKDTVPGINKPEITTSSVAPEPATLTLAGLAALLMPLLAPRRRLRKAGPA
jgi:hypothetical protein